jgi:hypothetical protein
MGPTKIQDLPANRESYGGAEASSVSINKDIEWNEIHNVTFPSLAAQCRVKARSKDTNRYRANTNA